jgi:hypothetical protein
MGRGEPEFNLREKADYGTPAAGAHVRRKFFEAVKSLYLWKYRIADASLSEYPDVSI